MVLEDDILVKKCLGGEKDAFGVLVSKYKDAVYGLAYSKVRNFHDAQDITQESFIDAYRNLRSLKHPHRFSSWIYTIAANRCRMWLRKQPHEFLAFASDKRPEPETQAIHRSDKGQILDSVLDAINELPDATRLVMTLYYIDGLTCKEIGEFTGTSINTVMSKLRRARAKLRKEFTEMPAQTMTQQKVPSGFTTGILSAIERLAPVPQPPSSISRIIQTPWFISLIIGVAMMGGLYISSPGDPHNMWGNIRSDRIYPFLSESYSTSSLHQAVELVSVSMPATNAPDDAQTVLWKVGGKEIKGDGTYTRITDDAAKIVVRVLPELAPVASAKQRMGTDSDIELWYRYDNIQLWYRYDNDLYPGGIDNDHDGYPDNGDRMSSRRDGIDNDWDGAIDEAQTDKDGNDREWAEVNTWQPGELKYAEVDVKVNSGWSEITLQWDVSNLTGEFQYEFLLVTDDPPGKPFGRNDAMRSKIIIDHQYGYSDTQVIIAEQLNPLSSGSQGVGLQCNLTPGDVMIYKFSKISLDGDHVSYTVEGTRTLLISEIEEDGTAYVVNMTQEMSNAPGEWTDLEAGIGLLYVGRNGHDEWRESSLPPEAGNTLMPNSAFTNLYFVPFLSVPLKQGDTWSYKPGAVNLQEAQYTVLGFEEVNGYNCVILDRTEAAIDSWESKAKIACDIESGVIVKLDSETKKRKNAHSGDSTPQYVIESVTVELTHKRQMGQRALAMEKQALSQIESALTEHPEYIYAEQEALRQKLVEIRKQYPGILLKPGVIGMIADMDMRIAQQICFPNPFNPSVHKKLTFDSSAYGITILDYKSLIVIKKLSGSEWDGTDEDNQPVAPGLYQYRAERGGEGNITVIHE